MSDEITQLLGKEDGPTSIILAGVHGDEKCGVEAIKKILPNLQIEKGRVSIGFGNPQAIEVNKRFMDINLNRMFKNDDLISKNEKESYEYRRAQFLKSYLNQADALLDIHASHTPNSKPFIICEPNAKEVVKYLPVDLIVSGFDRLEPGGTDYYMNSIGKIGICVECGYLGDTQSAQTAEESIQVFLKARGHMEGEKISREKSYIQMTDIYLTKTDSFVLSKLFDDFETVARNQIIGTDGGKDVKAGKDGVILFARNRQQIGDEAFLLGENKNSLA